MSLPPDPRPEINYPLVEEGRPALYRAMKYWGKKPHNIWAEFIERYCPLGGYVLDPFAGSAVAAFEAVKLGRKAIALDLNPMTSFIIEVTASNWDEDLFRIAVDDIVTNVEANEIYQSHFKRKRQGVETTVLNYRWSNQTLSGVAVQHLDGSRQLVAPDSRPRIS